jgi:hypothetical protein
MAPIAAGYDQLSDPIAVFRPRLSQMTWRLLIVNSRHGHRSIGTADSQSRSPEQQMFINRMDSGIEISRIGKLT